MHRDDFFAAVWSSLCPWLDPVLCLFSFSYAKFFLFFFGPGSVQKREINCLVANEKQTKFFEKRSFSLLKAMMPDTWITLSFILPALEPLTACCQQSVYTLNGRPSITDANNKDFENKAKKGKKGKKGKKMLVLKSSLSPFVLILILSLPQPPRPNPQDNLRPHYQVHQTGQTTNPKDSYIYTGCISHSANQPKRKKDVEDIRSNPAVFVLLLFLRLWDSQRDLF
jgi:hypothetical protein